MSNDKKTSWGGVADWYDGLLENDEDSYQKKVIMPNLIRLVEPKQGMLIVDNACGQGYFSRAFASNGAQVIGADISKELIELAKKNMIEKTDLEFFVAPSHSLTFIESGSADVVTIILAIQNIEKLAETFEECSRILKVGGRLVFVLNHPAFRIPARSSWQWDEKENKQFRRLDGYMSDDQVKIDMSPGKKEEQSNKFTISFHRPLQSYIKALNKTGFSLTRLEEWISHKKSQPGPRSQEEDRLRKEIPLFACFEAKKD